MSRTVKKLKLTLLIMATQCMTFCFLVNFLAVIIKLLEYIKSSVQELELFCSHTDTLPVTTNLNKKHSCAWIKAHFLDQIT